MTGAQRHQRVVRARHRGAHPTSPRRAKPRGRPQAPDACASLRQSPAPPQNHPTTRHPARPQPPTLTAAPGHAHRHSKNPAQTICRPLPGHSNHCVLQRPPITANRHPRRAPSDRRTPRTAREKRSPPLTFHPQMHAPPGAQQSLCPKGDHFHPFAISDSRLGPPETVRLVYWVDT